MSRPMALFLCALQFLTRLPAPRSAGFQPDWITRSAPFFPVVGQIVGALAAVSLIAADRLWTGWVGAWVAIAVGVLVTGGLHEDGLADTADGLGGGQSPARRLEIMKDSRIGSYGALTLVLALGLKAAALAGVSPRAAATGLLAAHGLARAATVVAMRLTPYAALGSPGKWVPAPGGVTRGETALALILALWPLLLLTPTAAVAGLVGGSLLAGALALTARRLVGGHTGDVLGAVEQLFELGFLLGVAAAPALGG